MLWTVNYSARRYWEILLAWFRRPHACARRAGRLRVFCVRSPALSSITTYRSVCHQQTTDVAERAYIARDHCLTTSNMTRRHFRVGGPAGPATPRNFCIYRPCDRLRVICRVTDGRADGNGVRFADSPACGPRSTGIARSAPANWLPIRDLAVWRRTVVRWWLDINS